jgi:SAM-dependent methyltransferase
LSQADREPKERFSDRVADYVRYRPSYPVEVVRTLERELGIVPRKTRVVDIGSGTGISAQLFLNEGYDVIGVEPNAAMRAAGETLLASWPRFRSIEGSAEATTLPDGCADLVVAAQAFHWFDKSLARAEMLRILDRSGAVVLLWNDRKVEATPFLQGYDEALRKYSIDYTQVTHQNLSEADIAAFFGPGGCKARSFDQFQEFEWEGLLGRALSSSYVPLPGRPGHDELVAALRALFERHSEGGKVRFDYDTKLYFGPLG